MLEWLLRVPFVLLLITGAGTTSARADATAATTSARRLFEQGVELADEGRWAEAAQAFRRSRELIDRPSTTFNLANALVRLGRPLEARTELEAYLRLPQVQRAQAQRAEGERLLALAHRTIATLVLTVDPPTTALRIDGRPVSDAGAVRTIPLDPGEHVLDATAPGRAPFNRAFQIEPGATLERSVALSAPAVALGPLTRESAPRSTQRTSDASGPADDGNVFDSPWLWIGAGVAVAGATVAVVFLARGDEEPYGGDSGVVLEGLRF